MSRFTDPLVIGNGYDRKGLAELWGLAGYQACGVGVYTPQGSGQIILFVTREKERWMTPYHDVLYNDLLFWDGQKGHRTDARVVNAEANGEEIHLFYRDRRYEQFTYYGRVFLLRFNLFSDRPSEFVFYVPSVTVDEEPLERARVEEERADYHVITGAGIKAIDQLRKTKTRGIAQRLFRLNLLRLWEGSCAVTGVQEPRVLRSSHIKPWRVSDEKEKVDHYNGLLLIPNFDALFNEGLISFKNSGEILISSQWERDDQRRMHISRSLRLRTVHPESYPYLKFHRDTLFQVAT